MTTTTTTTSSALEFNAKELQDVIRVLKNFTTKVVISKYIDSDKIFGVPSSMFEDGIKRIVMSPELAKQALEYGIINASMIDD